MIRIVRLERENLRWNCGQRSEPRIPNVGVMTPMRISEEAGIWRDVLAKSTAVEVIVEKPDQGHY